MAKPEQISISGSISPQINRYYQKISRRYLAAFAVLLLLTVLYIAGAALLFGEYITYDNLKYMARDWNAMSIHGDGDFTRVVYNGSDDMRFYEFRGGLAAAGRDTFSYYDSTGVQLIGEALNYGDPAVMTSDKYMLVCDVGGTGYAVFNQLTRIISREAPGRIAAGDIADNGSMVLVFRSRETKYEARLYNEAFRETMFIYKDNYVIDAGISDDGERVILVSAVPEDTDFSCELELCLSGVTEPLAKISLAHTLPLKLYTRKKDFILLCDTGVYFYDYNGVCTGQTSFSGMNLRFADGCEESFAVLGSVNALGSENRVIVFGRGGVIYDEIVHERLRGVYASRDPDNVLTWMTSTDSVLALEADGTLRRIEPESGDILSVVPLADGAVLAQKTGAYKID